MGAGAGAVVGAVALVEARQLVKLWQCKELLYNLATSCILASADKHPILELLRCGANLKKSALIMSRKSE